MRPVHACEPPSPFACFAVPFPCGRTQADCGAGNRFRRSAAAWFLKWKHSASNKESKWNRKTRKHANGYCLGYGEATRYQTRGQHRVNRTIRVISAIAFLICVRLFSASRSRRHKRSARGPGHRLPSRVLRFHFLVVRHKLIPGSGIDSVADQPIDLRNGKVPRAANKVSGTAKHAKHANGYCLGYGEATRYQTRGQHRVHRAIALLIRVRLLPPVRPPSTRDQPEVRAIPSSVPST